MVAEGEQESPSRFLALGDSYTIGEGVAPAARWPALLVQALRDRGAPAADPVIIATTGWTTDELDAGITAARLTGPFDLVSLLIGVNDQYRGRSVSDYRLRFAGLLQRAVDFAGGAHDHVIVLSIPDWGVTPFADGRDRAAIAQEIDAFNAVNRSEADRVGVRYVDVTLSTRIAAGDPAMVAADGLHPSAAMYAEWCKLVLPLALAALHR